MIIQSIERGIHFDSLQVYMFFIATFSKDRLSIYPLIPYLN